MGFVCLCEVSIRTAATAKKAITMDVSCSWLTSPGQIASSLAEQDQERVTLHIRGKANSPLGEALDYLNLELK